MSDSAGDLYSILSIFVAIMTRCDMSQDLVSQLTAINNAAVNSVTNQVTPIWAPADITQVAAAVTSGPLTTAWSRVEASYFYPKGCAKDEVLRNLATAGNVTARPGNAAAKAGGR